MLKREVCFPIDIPSSGLRPQDEERMLRDHPFHSAIRSKRPAANLERTVPVLPNIMARMVQRK